MKNRWQMSRAGIFNFWFYDDQEFELSEGRLILRGANGSGKSVTMQSFLPLVLDGDKRPWRLDPFGSRDRRIDYYLLGDVDSGIQERTGYLYLEFYHPGENKTVTVGIGLRARKGVKAIGFWGFAITDQRHIGRDFFLYDRDQFQKHGVKVPLQRDQFARQLGEGGQMVREQAAYRSLVNEVLFGFDDEEAYQELLNLLIQLRSPKLSKDFKPSTIYDILTEALPPLQEEELRPLSEVLEDMDQIGDHLDELSIHRKEIERLDHVYSNYNQFLLYQVSDKVLQAKQAYDDNKQIVDESKQALADLQEQTTAINTNIEEAKEQLDKAQTEYDVLTKHEAMEKQDELEQTKQQRADIDQQVASAERREQDAQTRHDNAKSQIETNEDQLQKHQNDLTEKMTDIEAIARDSEFGNHDIYQRQWDQAEGSYLEASTWNSWKRDVAQHKKALKEAHQLALQERQAKERASAAEKEMSEAREERDQQETVFRKAEKNVEDVIAGQDDALFKWFQDLAKLPMSEDQWRTMSHRLQNYPETSYENVSEPARQVFEQTRDQWQMDLLNLRHGIDLLEQDKQKLQEERDEWQQKKDPEPYRREAREAGRSQRKEKGEQGAPLYALCDFREDLSAEEKANIESVLEYAGLLDTWIPADETLAWPEGIEEFTIQPSPQTFGYTLANVLQAVPPEDGWISGAQIERLLQTIDLGGGVGQEGISWVDEQGRFQLGALYGQVAAKPAAEFIGKKTREQTRLAKIAQLEEKMAELQQQIDAEAAKQTALEADMDTLRKEIAALPGEQPLQEAEQFCKDAENDLQRTQQLLEKKSQAHQQKVQEWRSLQQSFLDGTSQWSRLNNESTLAAAMDDMQDYQAQLSELEATSRIVYTLQQQLTQLKTDMEKAVEQWQEEQDLVEELQSKKRHLDNKIETLTQLLDELGILDVHKQLQSLQEQIQSSQKRRDEHRDALQKNHVEQARCEERLNAQMEQFETKKTQYKQMLEQWRIEWQRGLLPEWQSTDDEKGAGGDQDARGADEDEQSSLQMSRAIIKYYRKTYEQKTKEGVTNACLDVFAEVKNSLVDYALERSFDESGERLLIWSMRDRQHPLAPSVLKEELTQMEDEQRRLLNEKDRQLYEQIILHSVGKAIRHKIYRAENWVKQMNRLMDERKTSSGLKLSLRWEPRTARNERELDTNQLVTLLKKDPELLRNEEKEQMIDHFRSRIRLAEQEAEQQDTLRKWITELLDYRSWFDFTLYFKKADGPKRQLTDARFNVLSGGEKAMSMYIPLFAATYSRYSDSNEDAPKIISLDEAFAGVDEENMRDMFKLLTDMDFDFMMTSQVLWGCYDTVPNLSIYELLRPDDADFVTLIRYHWNGYMRRMVNEKEPVEIDE